MKKITKYSPLLLLLLAGQTVVSAATYPDTVETDASAGFVTAPESSRTPVKPGTDVAIEIEKGTSTDGLLRFEYIPQLNFGSDNVYKVGGTNYQAVYNSYKQDDGTGTDTKVSYAIPAFVQVTDQRGISTKGFNVKVQQKTYFKNDGDNHKLEATRIYLTKGSYTNTAGWEAKLTDLMSAAIKVPVAEATAEAPVAILQAKDVNQVDGSISSLVFADSYNEADYGPAATTAGTAPALTDRQPAVELRVPNGEALRTTGIYKTTLEWTLEDVLL